MAERDATEIRTEISAVDTAITAVLTGGRSYSLDDGQTKISVTRSTLPDLRRYRADLIRELNSLTNHYVVSAEVRR